MPTKVLLITGSYPPERCGVGDYSERLAIALAAIPGVAVSVLTTGTAAGPSQENGVAVARILPDWSLARIGVLLGHLLRTRPDIVHVQYPTQGYRDGKLAWLIPLLTRCLGKKVVQTWHEGYDRDLAKFLLLALSPSRVIVVRKAFTRQFGRAFGFIAGLRRLSHISAASTLPKVSLSAADITKVRTRFRVGERRLLLFFGFIQPAKQIEQIFQLADPGTDHILVVGGAGDQIEYLATIAALTRSEAWAAHAEVTGFMEAPEAATVVAAADALVLPLKGGGGEWNTAILAGILQGTFVLTTSTLAEGYDAAINVYYAAIDDVAEMKRALDRYAGVKRADTGRDAFDWPSVAERHLALYRSMLLSHRKHSA